MQKCIRENGAVLSSAFAKLGIVIPVTASILFLGEIPTLFQLVNRAGYCGDLGHQQRGGLRRGRRRRISRRDFCSFICRQRYGRRMSKVTERIGERRFDALFLFYTF